MTLSIFDLESVWNSPDKYLDSPAYSFRFTFTESDFANETNDSVPALEASFPLGHER